MSPKERTEYLEEALMHHDQKNYQDAAIYFYKAFQFDERYEMELIKCFFEDALRAHMPEYVLDFIEEQSLYTTYSPDWYQYYFVAYCEALFQIENYEKLQEEFQRFHQFSTPNAEVLEKMEWRLASALNQQSFFQRQWVIDRLEELSHIKILDIELQAIWMTTFQKIPWHDKEQLALRLLHLPELSGHFRTSIVNEWRQESTSPDCIQLYWFGNLVQLTKKESYSIEDHPYWKQGDTFLMEHWKDEGILNTQDLIELFYSDLIYAYPWIQEVIPSMEEWIESTREYFVSPVPNYDLSMEQSIQERLKYRPII